MKKLLIASLCAIGLSACSSDPDFEVTISAERNPFSGGLWENITITAIEDQVELSDVVINRGDCKYSRKKLPAHLTYGESLTISVSATRCDVRELQVTTASGSWTQEFTGY